MIAGYLIKERIEAMGTDTFGETLTLFPGTGAEIAGSTFGVYGLVQNTDYDQPYLHKDVLDVRIFHELADKIFTLTEELILDLNGESFADHELNDNTDGIRFTNITTRVTSSSEYAIINNNEVFGTRFLVLFEYVKD